MTSSSVVLELALHLQKQSIKSEKQIPVAVMNSIFCWPVAEKESLTLCTYYITFYLAQDPCFSSPFTKSSSILSLALPDDPSFGATFVADYSEPVL